MKRTVHICAAIAVVVAAGTARAQGAMEGMTGMAHPHTRPFTVGGTDDWTLGVPHVDLNGGVLTAPAKDALVKISEGYVSARLQMGLGSPNLQFAATTLFLPRVGTAAEFTGVIQFVPTDNDGPIFAAVGAGVMTGRSGGGTRAEPIGQATLGWRTPVHEITPFVQMNAPLSSGARVELQFGVSHPLAPWTFHIL